MLIVLTTIGCTNKKSCKLVEIVENDSVRLNYENDSLISFTASGEPFLIKTFYENEVDGLTSIFDENRNLVFQKRQDKYLPTTYEQTNKYDDDKIIYAIKKRFEGHEYKSLFVLEKFEFIYDENSRLKTINSDITVDRSVGSGADSKETLEIEYYDLTSQNPYFINDIMNFSISRLGSPPLRAPFFHATYGHQNRSLIKSIVVSQLTEPTKIYEFKYQFDDQGNVVRVNVSGEKTAQYIYNYDCN